MDYGKLFHEKSAFQRETFMERMDEYGFKNMSRLELFLWDLELFLHIQEFFGKRVVLKGSAATQFYLPIEAQRTSVDIDMMLYGDETEIDEALSGIERNLGEGSGMFHFTKHVPKDPKTTLPLYTYYADVPSVLTNTERNVSDSSSQVQELKVEFIMQPELREFARAKGENIFAVRSPIEYQILPLNVLFADKLTTVGRNTIGVQDERMDEQVKQFYDIMMLIKHRSGDMEPVTIKERYLERVKEEWTVRAESEEYCRENGSEFSIETVADDVREQLMRYEKVDNGEDRELKKAINDFKSLYLSRKVDFSPAAVANGASLIRLMFDVMLRGDEWNKIEKCFEIEKKLSFGNFKGKERGEKVREAREILSDRFAGHSVIPQSSLRGKNPIRIFWAVANIDDIDEISRVVDTITI